jgi:hypothetical protein
MFSSPQRWFTGIAFGGIVLTLAAFGPAHAADEKCAAKGMGMCQDGDMCAGKCKAKGACDKCEQKQGCKADGMCAQKGMCMAKGKGKCMNKAMGAGKDMGMCKDMCMDGGMGMCKGMGMGGKGMGMMGMAGGKGMGMMGMNQGMGCCMGGMRTNMEHLLQQQAQNVTFQKQLKRLAKQSKTSLPGYFQDSEPEVRAAAAWVAGDRRLALQSDLIGLLTDSSELVRQSARRSLVLLSMPTKTPSRVPRTGQTRGIDFGPLPGAGEAAQSVAAQQWQQWWDNKP